MERSSAQDVRAAIALAVSVFGRKHGWHQAAHALGIAERTARGVQYREATGAAVHPDRALAARIYFTRLRAAQLRAELAQIEDILDDGTSMATRSGSVAVGR